MRKVLIVATAAVVVASASVAFTQPGLRVIREALTGFQEVPVVSTTGHGEFRARISDDESSIAFELTYRDLEGGVLQAHIHLGQFSVNGGISTFLCTNLGNGPMGTQFCPPSPGKVEGVIMASDIIGPAGQGIEPGALDELIAAIRAGKTYVNVHSTRWPGGEIRSQLGHGPHTR